MHRRSTMGTGDGESARTGAGSTTMDVGKRTLVQRKLGGPSQPSASGARGSSSDVHAAASRGVATPTAEMPHHAAIQSAFGHHDVSSVQAHVGGDAAESAGAMGAQAYATGNHVVFGETPDLHTAAHEAAHVVQQRAGVALYGGVGDAGDAHEQHADAVADRVVRGESAVELLDQMAPGGGRQSAQGAPGPRAGLQMQRVVNANITAPTLALIQRVLAADPVLNAMWAWIEHHPAIVLTVENGGASVLAPSGAQQIRLRLNDAKSAQNNGAEMLGTITHELTLHMLPWARQTMARELLTEPDANQQQRIATVLTPAQQRGRGLGPNLEADHINKQVIAIGGNHADLALWAQHLRTLLVIAQQEHVPAQRDEILATGLDKMYFSVLLTGNPAEAVDRGPTAKVELDQALNAVVGACGPLPDPARADYFATCVAGIRRRAAEYAERSYTKWYAQVEALFLAEYGMPLRDAPDHDFRGGYDRNLTAQDFYDAFLSDDKAFTGHGQPARRDDVLW